MRKRPRVFRCHVGLGILAALVGVTLVAAAGLSAAERAATVEQRLAEVAQLLASDELEGRGVGTRGLERAAVAIADQFREIGLDTELFEGTPFQSFEVTAGARLGATNTLALVGPPAEGATDPTRLELEVGKDFNSLAIGGSGRFRLPLVFAGYGITGREENYDDYGSIDVKGKAVVLLRKEPQQANPHSVFNGTEHSQHASFRRKVSNAFQHGAAAVIFCTDRIEIDERIADAKRRKQAAVEALASERSKFKTIAEPTAGQTEKHHRMLEQLADDVVRFAARVEAEQDPVLAFERAGTDAAGRSIPVIHCRRGVIDQMLRAVAGKDLSTLEKDIDRGPTPQSFELTGWQMLGQTEIERDQVRVRNVLAVLEGEGPLAEETVIVGAHYDHLGLGGPGSKRPDSKEVHNGADDNASGTSALLEIARQLASREQKLPRRVVFIAFTAEERGLLGSAHYLRSPLVPVDRTVAMLNLDMVGRLTDNKLIVNGTGTAKEFSPLLDRVNERLEFHLIKKPAGAGPSDHAEFYAKGVPVLHFFTGNHADYHAPSDDFEKLDVVGMRRIAEMVAAVAVELAESPARPTFEETKQATVHRSGTRPYFGSIPDFRSEQEGYALSGVTKGSPAERAGIRGGDVLIRFGDSKIGNLEDFDGALRKYQAGDKVPIVVRRGDAELRLEVTLDPPR